MKAEVSNQVKSEPEGWLTAQELAAYLRVSYRWVKRRLPTGELPPHYDISPGIRRWRVTEVEAWLATRRRTSSRSSQGQPEKEGAMEA